MHMMKVSKDAKKTCGMTSPYIPIQFTLFYMLYSRINMIRYVAVEGRQISRKYKLYYYTIFQSDFTQ